MIANWVFAILLFLTCIIYYFTLPYLSVFSLLVPLLFIINLVFVLFWAIKRNRRLLLSLSTLLIAYIVFGSFYRSNKESETHLDSDIKIMTYNVWGFNKNEWIKEPNIGDKIIDFIAEEDPDILCLQEHSRIRYRQLQQYPYRSETPYSQPRTIQAIFSKFPIVSSGSLDLPNTINNVIYADLLIDSDTVRIYNIHLQSFNIVPSSETFSEEQSQKNYKRLVTTFEKQRQQVEIFDEHRASSPYRVIVTGDLNNTQFSSIYRILKGDLQDSFLEKGEKFGRTYNLFGFPLRIDYILAEPEFKILSHQNFDVKLSDHYPIVATVRIKSEE
ncbi:endonuclease/exonuclease/phosphatase family protein [Flagellimonas allohymeniacidonis]|uniref:Endonuclease n=1 Tax=Flagellimonas allohymeniacidonis TaxID=2517819 RepID=A0A4Q8QJ36_9FLAO|nr:endonuclease/exonuclease/phosphatase family protein [Allomuricauda hymeniacidonis]TAI49308.1 endonuclease [Allomuricauda hymeniacidonis]